MSMKLFSKTFSFAALLTCSSVQAAGIYLYEIATNDLGLASAGAAARAQDPSVLATNPAGISNLSKDAFTGGLQGLYGDTEYRMKNGKSTGDTIGYVAMGSAFYSQPINDQLSFGIGLYGNYGLALEFDNFSIASATTQAIALQPTFSYQINDYLAVGYGLGINLGVSELKIHGIGESDDTDMAFNNKVGLLYSPTERTRLGLSYTSEMDFDFSLLDQNINSVAPQQVVFSAFHQLDSRLALMGNLNWQDWSEYETFTAVPTQDTYHIAFGSRYKVNKELMWNMGIAYDTSMYKSQNQGDFSVPTGKALRLATGMEYQITSKETIGLAFETTLIESSTIHASALDPNGGRLNTPTLYFITTTYTWKN